MASLASGRIGNHPFIQRSPNTSSERGRVAGGRVAQTSVGRPLSLLLVFVMLAAFLALTSSAYASGQSPAMVQRINEVRAAHGLASVAPSRSLARSASRYSRSMVAQNYFGHAREIRASSRFTPLGEILEEHDGRAPRIVATVRAWMASPGHRAAVLNPSFRQIGASRTYGRLAGRPATVWVVHLGRR